MDSTIPAIREQLPLAEVELVTFYKRDELTTDLICCEVRVASRDWFFHEEATGWKLLLDHLAALPGFDADWFSSVSKVPFERSETIAFKRS
jgi:hypothetical protein